MTKLEKKEEQTLNELMNMEILEFKLHFPTIGINLIVITFLIIFDNYVLLKVLTIKKF